MRRWGRVAAVTLALALGAVSSAHAQQSAPSASEVAAARTLFRSGVEALGEERWAEAERDFGRSFALAPRASTALNLATVHAELDHVVAAIESYRAYLSLAGEDDDRRPEVETAIAELEPRVAHVTLELDGFEEGDVLTLDGSALPPEGLGLPLPMDGGRHVFEVERGGESVGRVELTLVEGEQRGVTIPLLALAPPVTETPGGGEDDLLTSPWLWLGVGGGVLLIALAVGLGVGLSDQAPSYFSGTFGPGRVTFE